MSKLRETELFDEIRFFRNSIVSIHKFKIKGSLSLLKRMRACHKLYNWRSDEFFYYNYDALCDEERKAIVSDLVRKRFAETINPIEARQFLNDKWSTFEFYNKFFNREACFVTPANNQIMRSRYDELIASKKKLIIKPLRGTLG